MTAAEEFILSTYVPIKDLSISNIGKVCLVHNIFDNQYYIKRTLLGDSRDVYNILKVQSFLGIPQIKEVFYNGNTIILEEYVEGKLLSDVISDGINESILFHIATELLSVMSQIHSHHICHRDIKEANILVRPNQSIVLTDFGIAQLYSTTAKENSFRDTVGTVAYAAPEQFGLATCDCRSDIFSFGKICENLVHCCFDISASSKQLWEQIIRKCTEFHPHNRYQTANEILNIIKQPALFHGNPAQHIINFAHAAYPLCVQIHNDEQKMLNNFPPYDRFIFSENIFNDVSSVFPNRERLTEFFLLNHSILAVRMLFTYNTLLSGQNIITDLFQARIITFSTDPEIHYSEVYESLSGFSVLGNYETLLNRETMLTYPL